MWELSVVTEACFVFAQEVFIIATWYQYTATYSTTAAHTTALCCVSYVLHMYYCDVYPDIRICRPAILLYFSLSLTYYRFGDPEKKQAVFSMRTFLWPRRSYLHPYIHIRHCVTPWYKATANALLVLQIKVIMVGIIRWWKIPGVVILYE